MKPFEPEWTVLTPESGRYTFGYYDRCAWDLENRRHLALRIPQEERLPASGETAAVGYLDRDERRFVRVAETRAWCHQQGAMTLWLPRRPGCFIFNDYEPAENRLVARIAHVDRGIVGRLDVPVYAISPDGSWGVTLNFGRIPRRGYSYADAPVPADRPVPDLDAEGLFAVDLETGKTRLLASYRAMIALHPTPWDLESQYLWLNHAIVNVDGSRALVLFRHCADPAHPGPWKTHMFTVGREGENLVCSLPFPLWKAGSISHQIWGRTPREILVDANWADRGMDAVVFDETVQPLRATRVSRSHGKHAHLVFSPDGRWIAADSYPQQNVQTLSLIRAETGEARLLGRFRHEQPPGTPVDVRCDLHPRWSRDSRTLTIDTLDRGERKILLLDLEEVFERYAELPSVIPANDARNA